MTSLCDQTQVVLECREEAAKAKAALEWARKKWEEDNAALIADARYCADRMAEAEGRLREMALASFQATGDKNPGPGVSIRMMTRLEYNLNLARLWAQDHRMFLTLDTKTFEKFVKSGGADQVPFVNVIQEPSIAIAVDLSKALGDPVEAS